MPKKMSFEEIKKFATTNGIDLPAAILYHEYLMAVGPDEALSIDNIKQFCDGNDAGVHLDLFDAISYQYHVGTFDECAVPLSEVFRVKVAEGVDFSVALDYCDYAAMFNLVENLNAGDTDEDEIRVDTDENLADGAVDSSAGEPGSDETGDTPAEADAVSTGDKSGAGPSVKSDAGEGTAADKEKEADS